MEAVPELYRGKAGGAIAAVLAIMDGGGFKAARREQGIRKTGVSIGIRATQETAITRVNPSASALCLDSQSEKCGIILENSKDYLRIADLKSGPLAVKRAIPASIPPVRGPRRQRPWGG